MSISNEQAIQELLQLKQQEQEAGASDISRAYRSGLLIGTSGAYWTSGIISYAQYQMLVGMKEEVPA